MINFWTFLPTGYVFVVYEASDLNIKSYSSKNDWKKGIGELGIWTVNHTKLWIKDKFIPRVINYYQKQGLKYEQLGHSVSDQFLTSFTQHSKTEDDWKSYLSTLLQDINDYQDRLVPLSKVSRQNHLLPYLNEVQSNFYSGKGKVSGELIVPYYTAFLNLIKQVDETTINFEYVGKKIRLIDGGNAKQTLKAVVSTLEQHISRVKIKGFDEANNIDVISRAFLSILEDGVMKVTQVQLNEAKSALELLWQECRFRRRFIELEFHEGNE